MYIDKALMGFLYFYLPKLIPKEKRLASPPAALMLEVVYPAYGLAQRWLFFYGAPRRSGRP